MITGRFVFDKKIATSMLFFQLFYKKILFLFSVKNEIIFMSVLRNF